MFLASCPGPPLFSSTLTRLVTSSSWHTGGSRSESPAWISVPELQTPATKCLLCVFTQMRSSHLLWCTSPPRASPVVNGQNLTVIPPLTCQHIWVTPASTICWIQPLLTINLVHPGWRHSYCSPRLLAMPPNRSLPVCAANTANVILLKSNSDHVTLLTQTLNAFPSQSTIQSPCRVP